MQDGSTSEDTTSQAGGLRAQTRRSTAADKTNDRRYEPLNGAAGAAATHAGLTNQRFLFVLVGVCPCRAGLRSIQADFIAGLNRSALQSDALRAFALACQSEHTLRRPITPHTPNALANNTELPGSGAITQYPVSWQSLPQPPSGSSVLTSALVSAITTPVNIVSMPARTEVRTPSVSVHESRKAVTQ